MKKRMKMTGIVKVDRMLDENMALMLSYEDYRLISKGSWCDSPTLRAKLNVLLPAQRFLMLPQDTQGKISGYTVLEYLHQLQLSLRVARFVLERFAKDGGDKDDDMLFEKNFVSLITETIRASSHELGLENDADFQQYYEIICARMLLLPHGVQHIRRRGLSIHEIVTSDRFGDNPTHDLTDVFILQVFAEVPTFDGEMDYHAYLDFTLQLNDIISISALRFFWGVLDFHKQGFLDAFTLDFFLRSLLEKIYVHEGREDAPTIHRLRTQVFDAVAPAHPAKITWQDLQRCKLGHAVVRFLTDYVAYRTYEHSFA
ncbi:hypothetical protein BBJ29_002673 [Phytophthora kernoviae]|uniref:Uncharacterized protein n=1 Tax=Phytophthora kernoviae TaxID=325452 RepID=A0A3F2RUQ9_9STRA|nr:hypothetical protein BBJ29_002673 [Phytophthora kernoviae]RLN64597.1 hypothetical protein BBP00_00003351 [Phytophthora kernoviae]